MLLTRRSLLRGALAAPAIVLASRLDFVPRGLVMPRAWTLEEVTGFGAYKHTVRTGLPPLVWRALYRGARAGTVAPAR